MINFKHFQTVLNGYKLCSHITIPNSPRTQKNTMNHEKNFDIESISWEFLIKKSIISTPKLFENKASTWIPKLFGEAFSFRLPYGSSCKNASSVDKINRKVQNIF